MKLGHMVLGVCIHVSQCGTELGVEKMEYGLGLGASFSSCSPRSSEEFAI